jgi:hypothetical protein
MTDSPGTSAPPTEVDPLTVFDPIAMARHTTHGNLAMQLRDIERQAGVRRTL